MSNPDPRGTPYMGINESEEPSSKKSSKGIYKKVSQKEEPSSIKGKALKGRMSHGLIRRKEVLSRVAKGKGY